MFMKKDFYCKLIIMLLTLIVVLSSSISAAANEAEEPIDFDTVDWDTLDLDSVHRQLFEWFDTAELPALFRAEGHVDGAFATGWGSELSLRMKNDFAGFIAALSQEDNGTQQRIVEFMTSGIYHDMYEHVRNADFPDMVNSVKISGSKQQYTLSLFQDAVAQYWGIPRTGDRFPIAAITLCATSLSLICLLTLDYRRRKYT